MTEPRDGNGGLADSIRSLEILCEHLDETMPLRTALTFLRIAEHARLDEKPDMRQIGQEMNQPSAMVSRDVGMLSQFSRANEGGGLELVEAAIDLKDRRRRTLALTSKGKAVADAIERKDGAISACAPFEPRASTAER